MQPAIEGSGGGRKISVEEMDYGKLCTEIAVTARGMSGREIAKLGVAWQAAGYASEDGVLTRGMIMERVKDAVRSHSQKIRYKCRLRIGILAFDRFGPLKLKAKILKCLTRRADWRLFQSCLIFTKSEKLLK